MYSAYLFLAFIIGQSILLVESELTVTQDDGTTTATQIGFVVGDTSSASTITAKRLTEAEEAGGQEGTAVTGTITAGVNPITDDNGGDGLDPGTKYIYKFTRTVSSQEQAAEPFELYTRPNEAAVTLTEADSTTAKFDWTNYDDYDSHSVTVGGKDAPTPTSKTVELSQLEKSKEIEVIFKGKKNLDSLPKSLKICTAPSEPTVTNKIESDGATTPVNKLTLTIAFSTGDLVTEIILTTEKALEAAPTCEKCTPKTLVMDDTSKIVTLTPGNPATDAPTFEVVFDKYFEATVTSDIKIEAKYKTTNCEAANVGKTATSMKSMSNKANKEAMLVYLAIGTMAIVLRLLGMEVWTPLGLL